MDGGINVANLQWGPGNQYAYDPTSGRYYMGNQGDLAWGNTPNSGNPNAVGSIGSTMYSTADIENKMWNDWLASKGGSYNLGDGPGSMLHMDPSAFAGVGGLSPELMKLFAPGMDIRSWDASLGAPKAETVKQVPDESFWSMLNGGTSDPNSSFGGKPWWGGSPLAAFAGAAGGFAAGAGGAAGAGAGAGESVSGAYGATAGELGGYAGTYGGGAGAGVGAGLDGMGAGGYEQFLQSIGIDPASTQFAGGTMSNADIMAQIYGGAGGGLDLPNLPPGASQLLKAALGGLGGAGGATGGGGTGGGFNLASLLPLLGVGSGLNTMFNRKDAVDPARVNSLWQAGQDTYNRSLVPNAQLQGQANDVYNAGRQTYQTALDPQNALYNRTQQQLQDQTRASQSARGTAMGPYGAGVENKAMSDFNIDWTNNQLQRQVQGMGAYTQGMQAPLYANAQNMQQQQQGLQGFTGAGNTAAQAGIANNAQAFLQNQTGLNNLTTGLGQLFGGGGTGGAQGGGAANPFGQWINNLFSGGSAGGGAPDYARAVDPIRATFPVYSPYGDQSGYYGGGDTGWGGVGNAPY